MSNVDAGRLAAVIRKELSEYRRSRSIIGTMMVLPVVFLIEPLLLIFRLSVDTPASAVQKSVGAAFIVLLITPAILPAVLSAYSVIGEREQGTLEPLLTTPVSREELLLGKALATIGPSVVIAYAVFAVIELSAQLFAQNPAVATELRQGPHVLAEILFAPLLAGWSSWVGIGISTKAGDMRVAQQLGTLASLPPLGIAVLMSLDVVTPSVRIAILFGLILLAADVAMWRVVSSLFDRERLITGMRAAFPAPAGPPPSPAERVLPRG